MIAVQESVVSPVENVARAGGTPIPRKRRPWTPGPRDQEIYLAVQAGRTQQSVADEYKVSQPTVSRTVRRFDAWRSFVAEHDPQAPEPETTRRSAFELEVCRRRLEEVYRLSMRLAERLASQPAVTRRQGERNGKPWSELTERDGSVTASQCLKTALRASEALLKLDDTFDYKGALEAELAKKEAGDRGQETGDRGQEAGVGWDQPAGRRPTEIEVEAKQEGETERQRDGERESTPLPSVTPSLSPSVQTEAQTCINVHKADEAPLAQPQYSEFELEILKHTVDGVYKPPRTEEEEEAEDRRERRKWARMNKWDVADDALGRLTKRIQKRDGIPSERELYG